MNRKVLKIIGATLFWIITAFIMIIIFKFSADTGVESQEISQNLLSVIIEYIGTFISENVLRKMAHFSEYAALGFFMFGSVFLTFNKRKIYLSLIPCVLYSVSDEIHQYFVPERACRIFDIFIDSLGSLTGILVFMLVIVIINKITYKS